MGVAPTSVTVLRRHAAAVALGKNGQCPNTAIAARFAPGTDPAVKVRVEIVQQWFQLWAEASPEHKEQIRRLWAKQIPRLSGSRRWSLVKGPIRAVIATLLDLKWRPVAPDTWFEPFPSDVIWQFCGVGDFCQVLRKGCSLCNGAVMANGLGAFRRQWAARRS